MSSVRLEGVSVRRKRTLAVALALVVLAVLVLAPAALAKGGAGANIQLKLTDQIVPAGTQVTLQATARPAEVGTTVSLYKAQKAQDWEFVATKTITNPSGKVTFTDAPMRHTYYRVKWTLANGRALYSRVAWQKVKAVLTVGAVPAPYQMGEGTPVVISGTLVPSLNGGKVSIQVFRRVGDALEMVAGFKAPLTAGAGDSSVYSTTWNAMSPGDYVVRAQVKRAAQFFGTSVTADVTL